MSGSKKPPFIAEWIINRLSVYKSKYQMNDDLLEEYNSIHSHKGRIRADFWYRRQCLHAIKFYIGLIIPRSCMMLKNYLKIALRNISRQKGYSFINIAGLAVGIACCILISLWCIDELSFDKFHNDIERLYRVGTVSQETSVFTTTSARLAPALKETFPQVEAAARIRRMSSKVIRKGEKIFTENRFMYANADFLEIFKFPFIYGNEDAALDRPYTVLLSRQMAEKYFGNNDPVGDTIIIENEDFEVTGVISDPRENTHLKYGFIASFKTVEDTDWFSNWQSNVFYTYIKLAPGTNAEDFENSMKNIAHRYSQKELEDKGLSISYFLHPVSDIHLFRYSGEGRSPSENLENIYSLSIIGLLILFIASINYVNLATARSSKRAKEIGQRKVVGAIRLQIIGQFLWESVLTVSLALFAGLLISSASLSSFNHLTQKVFLYSDLFQPAFILLYVSIVFVIGIAAGSYSAFFMSAFQPSAIIKSGFRSGPAGSVLRKVLVVFQFSITIILIVSTIVVYKQLDFMKNKNLGIDLNNKLMIPLSGITPINDNYETVKTEFEKLADVSGTTVTSGVPGGGSYLFSVRVPDNSGIMEQWMSGFAIDYDYLNVFDIELAAGRFLNREITSDLSTGAIINIAALKALGFNSPEEALDKRIWIGMGGRVIKIIGVTKDFHFSGLQSELSPLFMTFQPHRFNTVCLSLVGELNSKTLMNIENIWSDLFPGNPFDHYFLKEYYDRQYFNEEKTGEILTCLAIMAISISCLGLFGLASFIAEQRKKEMGIRKVYGASVIGIVRHLSLEFNLLLVIANIIALPTAYMIAEKYLQDFAYSIDVGFTILLFTSIITFTITILTISLQSIRTALANPVDSLRYE